MLDKEILFSSPIRVQSHTKAAFDEGLRIFAVDRLSELKRLAKDAPGSKVYIRLSVPNTGAAWPLDKKFGASADEVIQLMKEAGKLKLQLCGLAFHVGWCNSNISTWENSVKYIIKIADKAIKNGFPIEFVNIGGGFPAHNVDQYSSLKKIASAISPLLNHVRDRLGIEIWAEPGSFICANSSVLVSRVIDVAKQSGKNWVWIDAGVFQGFYWKLGGLEYNVISAKASNEKMKRWIVTGPTCDSQDIFTHSAPLPANLKEGDFLLIFPAGAYINSAKEYNGFAYPKSL